MPAGGESAHSAMDECVVWPVANDKVRRAVVSFHFIDVMDYRARREGFPKRCLSDQHVRELRVTT
jgi:hypothetical protein